MNLYYVLGASIARRYNSVISSLMTLLWDTCMVIFSLCLILYLNCCCLEVHQVCVSVGKTLDCKICSHLTTNFYQLMNIVFFSLCHCFTLKYFWWDSSCNIHIALNLLLHEAPKYIHCSIISWIVTKNKLKASNIL